MGDLSDDLDTNMALIRTLRRFLAANARLDVALARELRLHTTDLATLDIVFSASTPLTPGSIGEHLGLTSGATTGAIDRIERAGYVRRLPNPADRRGTLVEAVEGRASDVLTIYRDVVARYEDVLNRFSTDERQAAMRLLQALSDQKGFADQEGVAE